MSDSYSTGGRGEVVEWKLGGGRYPRSWTQCHCALILCLDELEMYLFCSVEIDMKPDMKPELLGLKV